MLGVSSSWLAVQGFDIRQSIEKIFSLGFDMVELGAAHRYEDNAIDTVKSIRKKYPDKNFTIHALFPPTKERMLANIASAKPEKIFQINKKMLDLARELNAELVGIHGGYAGEVSIVPGDRGFSHFKHDSEMPVEEAKRNAFKMLRKILDVAEKYNVKIAIENDDGLDSKKSLILKPEDFRWFLSQFNSPFFGSLIDLGHLYIASKSFGFDFYNAVESLNDRIFEIHIHDVRGISGHWHVGSGEIDFKRVFNIIGPKANDIPIVFEHHNGVKVEDIIKEKEYVKRLLNSS